jgi:GR25 family glycosyltransferase involved in LPS biosynthesis
MQIRIALCLGGSYFGSSVAVAALNIAELYGILGNEVEFVHIGDNTDAHFDEVKTAFPQWPIYSLREAASKGVADLLIDMVGVLSAEDRAKLARRRVFFAGHHGTQKEIDEVTYPAVSLKRNLAGLDEIWMWDILGAEDEQMWQVLSSSCKTKRLPFFWSSTPLQHYLTEAKHPLRDWVDGAQRVGAEDPWNVHICESNQSNMSSAVLPTVIVSAAAVDKAAALHSVYIHNSSAIKDNKFFNSNILENVKVPQLTYEFVGRQRCCDWILHPRTVVVGHLRFAAIKYYYFDCAFMGIPVIHNSVFLRQLGGIYEELYYENNSVSKAVEAFRKLQTVWAAKGGAMMDVLQIRRQIVAKFGIGRDEVLRGWSAAAGLADAVTAPVTAAATTTTALGPPRKRMNICFAFMWDQFQPDYNFFTLMLNTFTKEVNTEVVGLSLNDCISQNIRPNICIVGPFAPNEQAYNELYPGVPKVFFTGEHIPVAPKCPDMFLELGYNKKSANKGVIAMRLPLWQISIDWFGADNDRLANPRLIPVERCTTVSPELLEKKTKFCAFIVTNPANEVRNNAFFTLNDYKQVDSAGRLYNNIGSQIFAGLGGGGGEHKKLSFMEDYKFSIAYENQRADGYITEKILHAKAAGCVPIYWGAKNIETDFDPRGFINANELEGDALVEAVKKAETRWQTMAAVPALSEEKMQEILSRFVDITGIILNKVYDTLGPAPAAAAAAAANLQTCHLPPATQPATLQADTPICFSTYASAKYLKALDMWLLYVNQHRKPFKAAIVRVALAADITTETSTSLTRKYTNVEFIRPPTETPRDFPDLWDPQHFGWKIWLWKYNIEHSPAHIILYFDSGASLIVFPEAAVNVALANGICIYEDNTQKNKYWCSKSFCKELAVTEAELEAAQPLAGLITLNAASPVTQKLVAEAWKFAQLRHVLAGPKWEGVLPSGQPFGHRHDQSILAILGRRYAPNCWRPMQLDINEKSLRHTIIHDKCYYLHRGNYVTNVPFSNYITDSFVINLERRADRLEKFQANHAAFAVGVERWPAVDGRSLQLTPALARLFRPNDFFWKKAVMGCALSHLGLWWQLANEQADNACYLVFEDDARCLNAPAFMASLNDAMSKAPSDYDILYLGGVLPPNKPGLTMVAEAFDDGPWRRVGANQVFGQMIPTTYYHFCAYAYVISKKCAGKIVEMIKQYDGYHTSADHMMCNNMYKWNIYFLNDQPVGCIQDDDPKYQKAEFNNFSRIDSFDSDLWTNDERFSEAEIKEMQGSAKELSISAALRDVAPATATASASAPARTASASAPATATASGAPASRFFTLQPDLNATPSFSDYLEVDWLSYLLGKDLQNTKLNNILSYPLTTAFEQIPVCIVQHTHIMQWQLIFNYWKTSNQEFIAIHLSDECDKDPLDWYTHPNCKGVIRNYVRASYPAPEKVLTIPLGPAYGRDAAQEQLPAIADRPLVWSFEGTAWANRIEKLRCLIDLNMTSKLTLHEKWNNANYSVADYKELLKTSKFIPCARGINFDTFRLYETLEHKCIPIICREEGDETYYNWLHTHLPGLFAVPKWSEVGEFIQMISTNPIVSQAYCDTIYGQWLAWKQSCRAACSKLLG